MVAIDQVGRPGRIIRGRDDRIEMELLDGRVDSIYARILIDVERLDVGETEVWIDEVRIQRDRLRKQEDILVEEWHLNVGMSIVEVDRALKVSARDWHTHTGFEIFRAVTFEIVEQDEEFVISRREHESLGI